MEIPKEIEKLAISPDPEIHNIARTYLMERKEEIIELVLSEDKECRYLGVIYLNGLIPIIPHDKRNPWINYKMSLLYTIINICSKKIIFEYEYNRIQEFFRIISELDNYLNETNC